MGGSRAFPMGWPRTGLEESVRTPKSRIAEGLGAQTHRSLGSVTLALGQTVGSTDSGGPGGPGAQAPPHPELCAPDPSKQEMSEVVFHTTPHTINTSKHLL